MSKPTSYREQASCATCKHTFEQHTYDAGIWIYCTMGASPRPKCGELMMEEERFDTPNNSRINDPENWAAYDRQKEVWDVWSKDRRVSDHGICDHYEASEEGKEQ